MRIRQNPYLFAALTAIVVIVLFRVGSEDALLATVNAALSTAVCFHLALRVPPAAQVVTTTVIFAAMLYSDHFKWLTVLFAASVLLGLYYRRLARTLEREDDFLYIPLFYGLLFFSVLMALSSTVHHENPITAMKGFLETTWGELKQYFQDAGMFSNVTPVERGDLEVKMRERLFYYFTGSALAVYQVIVFFFGRFLRRRAAERIGKAPLPFAILRIREQYLFILILGIVAEIVGRYEDEQSLLYVSRTIFVITGTTFFLAGMSLVSFLFLMRRSKQGQHRAWFMFLPFGALFLFLLYPRICAVVGLLDVWFDFRRRFMTPA